MLPDPSFAGSGRRLLRRRARQHRRRQRATQWDAVNYATPNPRPVISAAAGLYDVTVEELCGQAMTRPLPKQRQATMVALRSAGYSHTRIGALFGRDHTASVYAAKRAAEDPLLAADAKAIVAAAEGTPVPLELVRGGSGPHCAAQGHDAAVAAQVRAIQERLLASDRAARHALIAAEGI